ncbi:hypothetical protein ABT390_36720 [Streptomyces aurantiacus]|uniref:Uncharacterized protein n=1 Tax=Streptomyces aurantiacus JA 4570 TaxID=1286094 RepID=S3ZCK9_9ACTN|nr:hypothetical protein [Streptomyces aurantiacus]EPH40878.1 hypothetical protein STRAU_6093 [Streptomyces aurantiacus JA 4570]
MSAHDFTVDPDDLDEDDLDRLAQMSEEDLTDLYEDPTPEDPLAGYARPATRAAPEATPGRGIDDLHPL